MTANNASKIVTGIASIANMIFNSNIVVNLKNAPAHQETNEYPYLLIFD